ncbi:Ig-like domain-containing protein [Azospirillum soli]|uniref:Ig-like domain-containing protein n=1 Tax=Azospirillum soli TaxID=1304799 RepID=UPI001AE495D4|nr:SwmB domain-containing protein [Azospirillum soli]MBP2313772.1 Ca2+-binding RTX toxin-like protein [Azospirillum soli]
MDSQFANAQNFSKIEYSGPQGNASFTLGATASQTFAQGLTITSSNPALSLNVDATAFTRTLTVEATNGADVVKGTSTSLNGATIKSLGATDTITVTDQDLSGLQNTLVTGTLALANDKSLTLTSAPTGKVWNVSYTPVGGSVLTLNDAPPGPSVSSITPAVAAGKADSVTFTVTFNEKVNGVTADDFTLTQTAGTTTGTVGDPLYVDGKVTSQDDGLTWTVPVTGMSGDGKLRLDLKNSNTGIASATTSNAITGGFTTGATYTFDGTAPTVTAIIASRTKDTTPSITVNTSDGTLGAGVANAAAVTIDVDLNNDDDFADPGETIHSTGSISNNTATFDLSALTAGTYKARARVTDAVGNEGTSAVQAFTIDTTAPKAHATTPITAADITMPGTYSGGDTLTLTFSEPVSVSTITLGNLQTGSKAVGMNASLLPVSPVDGYATAFTLMLGMGTDIVPGTILSFSHGNVVDTASNTATATVTFTVPQLGPSVTSITPAAAAAAAGSVDYTVVFSGDVTGVTADDFTLTKTDTANGTITGVTGSGSTYTVSVATAADTQGTLRLDLKGSGTGITDSGSRAITGGFTSGGTHTMDRVAPQITNVAIDNTAMKIGDTVTATITVTNDADDFTLSSGSIGGFALSNLLKTTNHSYTAQFTVTAGGTDVAAGADIPVNLVLRDPAGNTNSAYTTAIAQNADAIDANLPAVTAASVNGATVTLTFSEAVIAPDSHGMSVLVGNQPRAITAVSGSGTQTLTLTLDTAVRYGDSVLFSYQHNAQGSELKDAVGQEMADVNGLPVTNAMPAPPPDQPAPPTESRTVDGVVVETTPSGQGSDGRTVTIPVVPPSRTEQVGNNTVADIPLVTGGGASLLTAQVPTGFGLTVSGSGAPKAAGSSLSDLIREIQTRTAAGSADQTQLTGGGSGFLQGLPADTPLLVQTIVPTTAPGATAPGTPLVITGTPAGAGPQTALVIDTRNLPSGSEIQLQNVEFAAVIGAARVTGGEGSQSVWGDGASQYIVLGADDDTLHGGGGDDFVGSKTGNDVLYGDEGNDTVQGGEDHDTLFGGSDNDLLLGNTGADVLFGNMGADTLYAGRDSDTLYGGRDDDALFGNDAADRLQGDDGADRLFGNTGNDVLLGNMGADTLYGGMGNDTLYSGRDDDLLFGDLGDDWLFGDLGNDTLTGGAGADVFVFGQRFAEGLGDGHDVITDFNAAEGDRIRLLGNLTYTLAANGAGDAVIVFSSNDDVTLTGVRRDQVQAAWFVTG